MQVSEEVLRVLSGLEFAPDGVRIREQLERKLYVKTNEVLEAIGGKWGKKAKAHVFPAGKDPRELIDEVILVGEVTTHKDLGFFATPPKLAKELVDAARVREGLFCLEPSAGTGNLVDAMLAVGGKVFALELDEGRFDGLCDKYHAQPVNGFLGPWWRGGTAKHPQVLPLYLRRGDCMAVPFEAPMHRVVMNPPFRKVGLGDHLDHVRWAFEQLAPGGVLASVLPNGVVFRQDERHKSFRAWFSQYPHYLVGIPDNAFQESGTKVRTCMLKMEKP